VCPSLFHDCVGGCDGCVDLLNIDGHGLEVPIAAIDKVVASYAQHGRATRADIWALAAMTPRTTLRPYVK